MTRMPEKDVPCPHCQVYPPFTIKTNGTMITRAHYGMSAVAGPVTVEPCRRPWELALLDHIQVKHRDRFRELMADLAHSPAAT